MLPDRFVSWLEDRGLLDVSWPSLLRVMSWAVATIVVIGVVAPDRPADQLIDEYTVQAGVDGVLAVGGDRADQRGFSPSDDDDTFRIAWIAGSSVQGVEPSNRTFVPAQIRERIPEIDNRPVAMDMYFLSGMRILDEYAAVLEAIESEPDMIVVTLNPFWALNDRAIQGWDNLDGQLFAALVDSPSKWPILASTVGPGDALWGTIGTRLDAYRDRYYWGGQLSDRFGDASLLDLDPAEPDENPSELERVAAWQIPVFFWDTYANLADSSITGPDRQAVPFDYAADRRAGINRTAVAGIFQALTEADVPSYVYVAQIDDEIVAEPVASGALDRVETQIAEIADADAGDNVTVVTESAVRLVGDMNFRDAIHLFDTEQMADHLESELCTVIASNQWESSCER